MTKINSILESHRFLLCICLLALAVGCKTNSLHEQATTVHSDHSDGSKLSPSQVTKSAKTKEAPSRQRLALANRLRTLISQVETLEVEIYGSYELGHKGLV